ncbi:MAG: hypothetical protein HC880_05900, partial [Bacteroidia bacterium]|nr:hypothetical protein [Bacteroidia bacterium]
QGILIRNAFRRASARLNLTHRASEKLSLGMTLNLARTINNQVPSDNAFSNPVQLVALPPMQRPYLEDGSPNPNTLYYNNLLEVTDATDQTTGFATSVLCLPRMSLSRVCLSAPNLALTCSISRRKPITDDAPLIIPVFRAA